ncbi:MAG: DUF6473 family protein [Roseococcus sp.]|nr:DUF6473 family protein [Roseococcus sp.]
MGIGYQAVDRRVIDYDLWFAAPEGPALRGPRLDPARLDWPRALCCIGAAQTFGRFVHAPYPTQLGRLLGRPVLNLGVSGAGPEYYLRRPALMAMLARAGIAVVQVMSGRSVSAGVFRALDNNGLLEFLDGPRKGERMLAQPAYAALREEYGEAAFRAQVTAAQTTWVRLYRELAGSLTGRKLLLWISADQPGRNVRLERSPLGAFPHLVTAEMLAEVGTLFDHVVPCVLPHMPAQVLVNDVTGMMETVFDAARFPARPEALRQLNTYYATPDLHDLAARELARCLLRAGG